MNGCFAALPRTRLESSLWLMGRGSAAEGGFLAAGVGSPSPTQMALGEGAGFAEGALLITPQGYGFLSMGAKPLGGFITMVFVVYFFFHIWITPFWGALVWVS